MSPKNPPTLAHCLWCGEELIDGREISGYTKPGPDYMTRDEDFGCDASPDTNQKGTGDHTPDIFQTWDDHLVRVSLVKVLKHEGHEA
jgi:hypothetical protein